jgi:hypothetical protein
MQSDAGSVLIVGKGLVVITRVNAVYVPPFTV